MQKVQQNDKLKKN